MRHFHEPIGLNDFDDPATWDAASYSAHPVDSIEPLSDEPNGYRTAAIHYLGIMFAVDQFLETAPDARVAVVAVAVVLGWPSARGFTLGDITDQLGCSPSTLTRSIARFKTMAGLAGGGNCHQHLADGGQMVCTILGKRMAWPESLHCSVSAAPQDLAAEIRGHCLKARWIGCLDIDGLTSERSSRPSVPDMGPM